MKNQIEIVKDIADGMIGIGGVPTNEEFYAEFDFRLRAALSLGGVICRLSTDCLAEPLEFDGEPLYYKIDGIYGYITPINNKVFFIYSDADGGLYYDKLENWKVLNGI